MYNTLAEYKLACDEAYSLYAHLDTRRYNYFVRVQARTPHYKRLDRLTNMAHARYVRRSAQEVGELNYDRTT